MFLLMKGDSMVNKYESFKKVVVEDMSTFVDHIFDYYPNETQVSLSEVKDFAFAQVTSKDWRNPAEFVAMSEEGKRDFFSNPWLKDGKILSNQDAFVFWGMEAIFAFVIQVSRAKRFGWTPRTTFDSIMDKVKAYAKVQDGLVVYTDTLKKKLGHGAIDPWKGNLSDEEVAISCESVACLPIFLFAEEALCVDLTSEDLLGEAFRKFKGKDISLYLNLEPKKYYSIKTSELVKRFGGWEIFFNTLISIPRLGELENGQHEFLKREKLIYGLE